MSISSFLLPGLCASFSWVPKASKWWFLSVTCAIFEYVGVCYHYQGVRPSVHMPFFEVCLSVINVLICAFGIYQDFLLKKVQNLNVPCIIAHNLKKDTISTIKWMPYWEHTLANNLVSFYYCLFLIMFLQSYMEIMYRKKFASHQKKYAWSPKNTHPPPASVPEFLCMTPPRFFRVFSIFTDKKWSNTAK